MGTKNIIKCPFCLSSDVYEARHDNDWGGGNSFFPLNGQEPEEEINLDIKINYCNTCEEFGDFNLIVSSLGKLIRLNK